MASTLPSLANLRGRATWYGARVVYGPTREGAPYTAPKPKIPDWQDWLRQWGLEDRKTVTVEEAAGIVGISLRTLRSHIAADKFPHRRIGGRVVVPVPLLLQWLMGDDG